MNANSNDNGEKKKGKKAKQNDKEDYKEEDENAMDLDKPHDVQVGKGAAKGGRHRKGKHGHLRSG